MLGLPGYLLNLHTLLTAELGKRGRDVLLGKVVEGGL